MAKKRDCAHIELWPYIAYDNRYIVRYLECVECGYQSIVKLQVKHLPYSCTRCAHEWVSGNVPCCPLCNNKEYIFRPRFALKQKKEMAIKLLDGQITVPSGLHENEPAAKSLTDWVAERQSKRRVKVLSKILSNQQSLDTIH